MCRCNLDGACLHTVFTFDVNVRFGQRDSEGKLIGFGPREWSSDAARPSGARRLGGAASQLEMTGKM